MDWAKVQDLFDRASELPPAEVDAYLESACDDPKLRQTVRELLAEVDNRPDGFLGEIVTSHISRLTESYTVDRTGQKFGVYVIEKLIGRGGMGEVYVARRTDDEFEHRIALKIVRLGVAIDEILSRFRQERQILARLDHPNIVRLLDGGSTPDGLPYLAMDYVDGVPITDYCDGRNLDTKARCRLLIPVCDAAAHAHRHLIVHRDLKPANVLVTSDGVPKLLDFGIAKLLGTENDGNLTELRPLTPDYASPEQRSGAPITTATDVYQLGAILFRLVTGEKPDITATVKLPGDLENIVRRAMHTDPDRRYGSAQQLADDLQRYLDNRPILARPDSVAYQIRKWVQRSPVPAAVLALAVASTLIAAGVAYYQGRRAERRFEQVRSLATTFVFDFDTRIRDLPGALPARVFAVETAVRHLDSLSRESVGDQTLQLELAAAYGTIARIQGEPSAANIGRSEQALESLDKSIALAKTALDRDPGSAAALRIAAASLTTKGLIIAGRREFARSVQILNEALDFARRLEALPALTPADLGVIASANSRFADFTAVATPKPAVPYYRKALDLFDRATRQSGDKQFRVSSISSLIGLSRVSRDLGDPDEVIRNMETASAILEPIIRNEPANQTARRQLSVALTELSRSLGSPYFFHRNESARAIDVAHRIEALLDSTRPPSAAGAPLNFDGGLGRSLMLFEFASVHLLIDPAASAQHALAGIAITDELIARDPKHTNVRHHRTVLQDVLVAARLQMGQGALALPMARELRDTARQTLERNSKDLGAMDSWARRETTVGIALALMSQWPEAEAAMKSGIALGARFTAQDPEDLYFLRNYANSLDALGELQRFRGKRAEGQETHRLAIAQWEKWASLAAARTYPEVHIKDIRRRMDDPPGPAYVVRSQPW